MKNLLKKSAVATAVAGSLMISGVASADSLLAPLVIGINGGSQTYFSIKTRGTGTANARMASTSDLHYVWFKKNHGALAGAGIGALDYLGAPCEVSNNNGKASPWDMVLQRAVDNDSDVNLDPKDDLSVPNGYSAGDFVGFAVITDAANANTNPSVKDLANEGEMSGFGYIVNAGNNYVLDYKLLNNHRSKVEGDFSAGFVSKKSVDFSWMPTDVAPTAWFAVATGEDMLKADSGSGSYDATAYFSQDTASGSVSPLLPTGGSSGVYNNDEKVTSGAKNFKVTCIGRLERANLMNTLQLADTTNGGWKRMSIQNSATRTDPFTGSSVATTQVAAGSIIYKFEAINFAPTGPALTYNGAGVAQESISDVSALTGIPSGSTGYEGTFAFDALFGTPVAATAKAEAYDASPAKVVVSFQPETSGHLSATPEPHPNRPY